MIYDVETSDGRILSLELPDNFEGSDDDVVAMALSEDAKRRSRLASGEEVATPYPAQPERGHGGQLAWETLQGMTGNFGDEIAAGLASGGGEEYDRLLSSMRDINDVERADKPVTSFAGNVVGGFAPGAGVAKGLQMAKAGTGLLNAGLTGTALSAVGGAGDAAPGDRLMGGAVSGGIGGALSFGLGGIGAAYNKWARTKPGVQRAVGDALDNEALTPEELIARRQSLGDEATFADVDEIRNAFEANASSMKGHELSPVIERSERAWGRMAATVSDEFGDDVQGVASRAALKEVRDTKASPLYEQAFEEGANFDMNRNVRLALDNKYAKSALHEVKEGFAKSQGKEEMANPARRLVVRKYKNGELQEPTPTLRGLHEVAKILGEKAHAARKVQEDFSKARALSSARERLLAEIERVSPVYRDARQIWGQTKAMDDAMSLGAEFDVRSMNPAKLKELVRSLSPEEKRYYMLGVGEKLIENMRKRPPGAIPKDTRRFYRERLAAIDPAKANNMMKVLERENAFEGTAKVARAAREESGRRSQPGSHTPPIVAYSPSGMITKAAGIGGDQVAKGRQAVLQRAIGNEYLKLTDQQLLDLLTNPPIPRGATVSGALGGAIGGQTPGLF